MTLPLSFLSPCCKHGIGMILSRYCHDFGMNMIFVWLWYNIVSKTVSKNSISINTFQYLKSSFSNSQHTIIIFYVLLTNILITLNHILCKLTHITFLAMLPHKTSKSFLLCFKFGLVNCSLSFFLFLDNSANLSIPVYGSLIISTSLELTSQFNHHVSLHLAELFIHPHQQVLFAALTKIPFKTFQLSSSEAPSWGLCLYLIDK